MTTFQPPYFKNEEERDEYLVTLVIRVRNFFNAKLEIEEEDRNAIDYYREKLSPSHRLYESLASVFTLIQSRNNIADKIGTQ